MEDIGSILKKRLQQTESDVKFDADLEWFYIKPKVKQLNFFTKGFYHFNIYYVFAGIILISTVLFIQKFNTNPNTTRSNTISLPHEGNSKINSKNQIEEGYSGKKAYDLPMIQGSKDLKKGNEIFISTQQDVDSTISLSSQPTFVDILSTLNDTLALKKAENKNEIIHSKKTVVIINKQDTITNIDTLRKIKTKRVFQ